MAGDKAVMISIQPKWCGYIFGEKKEDEVRKDKPDLPLPFKAYIYCTKSGNKMMLRMFCGKGEERKYAGKVCGEFICNSMTYIQASKEGPMNYHLYNTALLRTCLTDRELFNYLAGNLLEQDTFDAGGWAWHISKLKIYDKPKDVSEFRMYNGGRQAKRPPQSWFYVEEMR